MCGFGDGWGLGCSLWVCGRFSSISAVFSTAKKFGWYVGRLFQQKEHTISIQWNELHFVLKDLSFKIQMNCIVMQLMAYMIPLSIMSSSSSDFFLFLFWRYMQPMSTIFYTLMPNTKWYMPHFESIYPCIFIWSSWDYQTNTNHFSNLVKGRFEIQWLFFEPEVYIIIYRR